MTHRSKGNSTHNYTIDTQTSLGLVALKVSDQEESARFYRNVMGFRELERSGKHLLLGVEDTPLISLSEVADPQPKLRRSTGLYHLGVLLPRRRDLARFLTHLLAIRYPLEGAADHGVSESLYFDDPDSIGIEVYADRHREDWSLHKQSENLTTSPLDAEDLLSLVTKRTPGWKHAPAQTRIGHVHLHVNDISEAEWFYRDILGFQVQSRYGSEALFLAAGDYHHHIGVNVWAGIDSPPPPENATGLDYFMIRIPDEQVLDELREHLYEVEMEYEKEESNIYLQDPAGNRIVICPE